MNCNNHYIGLGEVPVCSDAAVLPLTADTTGTWAFMSSFNGAYQYTQFQCTAGQPIVVHIGLNEHYSYTFRLYKPNNTIFNDSYYAMLTIPFLNGVEHNLSDSDTDITTGKLQHLATEGQTTLTYTALINAKQVVVFVEGALWQEGAGLDEYNFTSINGTISFSTPLIAEQKITILYFK
jgi:hypothetical protein